jgi:hypothetical protein
MIENVVLLESIPPDYEAWRACTTNRVTVPSRSSQAENGFLGSLKGLQIRTRDFPWKKDC